MGLKSRIRDGFRSGEYSYISERRLMALLGVRGSRRKEFAGAIRELTDEEFLVRTPSSLLVLRDRLTCFEATVDANRRGYAFLTPEGNPSWWDGSDLHVAPSAMGGAYNKDTVLAALDAGGGAFVLRVLKRGNTRLTGFYDAERGCGWVIPDDDKFCADIKIPDKDRNGAVHGDKVLAEITSYTNDRWPEGKVIEVLGRDGELLTEEKALIKRYGLETEFPEKAEAEADAASMKSITVGERRDLRDVFTVTIDGTDTRDMDDAVSVEKTADGYILGVHIADVTEYVKYGSRTDREAYSRGTSVYFPDRVLPMLPKSLSNGACSLNEGQDRYALSCMMTYGRDGVCRSYEIFESVIRSDRRLSYPEANAILGDVGCEDGTGLHDTLAAMEKLCAAIKERREAKGGINLAVKEAKIYYTDGKVDIPDCTRGISEDIIEQFMISANEAVASFARKHSLPILYRVHEPPAEEKTSSFMAFARDLGIECRFLPSEVTPKDYASVLGTAKGRPCEEILSMAMLRSMQKARYSEKNLGHFGLASDCYCHFTSPIRRYPDLFTHRTIKAYLHGKTDEIKKYVSLAPDAGIDTSERERCAADVERAADDLYKCVYISDRIGEVFDAVISGVSAYGIYAELKNTVEGMIRIDDLPDDDYVFYGEKFLLEGSRHRYRLCDEIKVEAWAVDITAGRIYFRQPQNGGNGSAKGARKGKK